MTGTRSRHPIIFVAAAMLSALPQPSRSQPLPAGPTFDLHAAQPILRAAPPQVRRRSARAETMLGFMYATGQRVPQNVVVATWWYDRAARRGNPTAQYLLGLMYDKGQGVPQDDIVAHMWLNLAASRARAREREYYARIRDAVATKLSTAELAQAQWLAWHWRPER